LKQCDISALKKMVLAARTYRKEHSWLCQGGQHILHFAAMSGQLQICEKILSKIKNKSPKDSMERSPIHFAAQFGCYDVCSLLLNKIIDKNPKDKYQYTPLHHAADEGHLEICILMIEEFGITTNVTLEDEETPLHLAAESGHVLTFSYLMGKAAVKNPQNKYGRTPLHFAAKQGHMQICKLIEKESND
jgi:ankyrin repeat protein